MKDDIPFVEESGRRTFLKRSLALGFVAAQPALFTGLVRAQGGTSETKPSTETTDQYTDPNDTTVSDFTTFASDTTV